MVDPYRPSDDYMAGYKEGYEDGWYSRGIRETFTGSERKKIKGGNPHPKKKRQLSAWNKFVKANSKKPRFIFRSGKLNLKKMGVAFRKTPAGKKGRK